MRLLPVAYPMLVLALAASPAVAAASGVPSRAAAIRFDERRLEIRLRPLAAERARAMPAADAASGARFRAGRLGVAGVDALAALWPGVRFEREFRGEVPPPAGSAETDFTAFYRVRLPAGVALEDALARLRACAEIESADPIPLMPGAAMPADSLWSVSTWYYQPSRHDIHAPEAWDVTRGDSSIVVGVLDTGVLAYHPDLAAQIWTNWAEANGIPGVDDDGNGYVDDIHGWDFVDLAGGGQTTDGEDWDVEDNDPSDFAGHGTMIAGIVGAATDNTIGVAGTNWNVRVMPLRIAWSENGSTSGTFDMSFAAEALLYAARMGVSVVNCSFETANTGGLLAAAAAATRAGVVIVSAAGNGGTPNHVLADREDVVAVGSTDASDVVSATSNTGPYVDLCAPGVAITSTFVQHLAADSISQRQPAYGTLGGTSFAAPFAAGAAALVQARQRALGAPALSPMDMLFRLRETADDITAENPGGSDYGTGRLNLYRALTETSTSRALRLGARTIGPAAVLETKSGRPRVAVATFNSRLIVFDGATHDTLVNAALPGRPARQLALGYAPSAGHVYFAGTINGKVAGFDHNGVALPGWPVSGPGGLIAMGAGPALGDVDGDDTLDVVCGADDGSVWAWKLSGAPLPGFPVQAFGVAPSGAAALADLDGVPGAEIVALSRNGDLTVLRGDGSTLAGWPQATGFGTTAISPVVAAFGANPEPALLVPISGGIRAYRPNGGVRFSSALGVNLSQEPALADLDGDGSDEIVLATLSGTAHALTTLDSSGTVRAGAGWPLALAAAVGGPPVAGPLGAGGAPGVLIYRGGTLGAYDGSAQTLNSFPKPGGAGSHPTLFDLAGDGRTKALAGTGPDSLFYVYDAGAGTWASGTADWPTFRGNFARTGSRTYSPALPVLDDIAPSTVADLAGDSIGVTGLAVRWSAPGDDGTLGTAAGYELQVATLAGDAGSFASGLEGGLPPPAAPGTSERFVISGLRGGTTYYVAVRAFDGAGNRGAASNVLAVTTPLGAPPAATEPPSATLHARLQPSRIPVDLMWSASPGHARSLRLYDVGGRRLRELALPADTEGVVPWDGRDADGRALPAGLYFARLTNGPAHAVARIVLLP